RYFFHFWRTGNDGYAHGELSWFRGAVGRVGQRARGALLVDGRWIHLGDWRSLSTICREIPGNQPRHPTIELQSTVGFVVGNFCFWGVTWKRRLHVYASHRGFVADDVGRRSDCVFFNDWRGTGTV